MPDFQPASSRIGTEPFGLTEDLSPDQLGIETPEQVTLHFPLAGVGSRFLAYLADCLVQAVAYLVFALVLILAIAALPRQSSALVGASFGGKWFVAILVVFFFCVYWGYYALFEAFWKGQTPGKRLLKIRVLKDSGRRITLFEALARNLVRIVDLMPGFYLIGIISILCTRENKRLGDLVANTIVVHERTDAEPVLTHTSRTFTAPMQASSFASAAEPTSAWLPGDAISRLNVDDLNLIDTFLSRALDLDLDKRNAMAGRIADRLFAKMNLAPNTTLTAERNLEAIAHAMRSQTRF